MTTLARTNKMEDTRNPPLAEVVDVHGAAQIVGLSPTTLATLRCRGGGPPYVRLGRRAIRYRVSDLREWRDARIVTSTADVSAAEREAKPKPSGRRGRKGEVK